MKASAGNRVLMLLENYAYPQDGRVRREAGALVAAGYRVAVICPAEPGQPMRETVGGVRVYRYPAPPAGQGLFGYLWEYAYSMAAALLLSVVVFRRDGFDVLHAHNPPDTFVFIAAAYKLLGKRFVYDHHDLAPEMYHARFGGRGHPLVYRTLVLLERLSCRLADHVIATNRSYKAVEMRRGGVPEARITIVRNGPELHRLRPAAPDAQLRRRGQTIIAYAGVIGFQDGVDYLLRALHHLATDLGRSDFCGLIIGKGDALPGLQALADRLGLGERVWFTGWLPDADYLRLLSAADVCVDPDPSNPFNDRSTMNKLMEYMALGKPVVAFDLPEHRFTAQEAARYVRPNDELAFARALAELMDDPERRRALGELGRRRVERELAWRHSVPNLLAAYRTLLAEAPGASRGAVRGRRPPPAASAAADDPYQVRVSEDREDPDWDGFVARTPGGDHVQTSLWAQVRARLGWRAARVVVTHRAGIVAGAQLLLRPLPLVGAVGYVPKGPLCAVDDAAVRRRLIRELQRLARVRRVRYLLVQPALDGEAVAGDLLGSGFRPTSAEPLPGHAVLLDLRRDEDELLAQMRPKTRYNLRLGERKGIVVREGTAGDLDTFYRLLVATARRQRFAVHPKSYFAEMLRVLGPPGYIKLFVAEYAGEAVSAQLLIAFGDTVTYKRGAWSGRHGSRHPNEAMHWAAIRWAKANGYRYYDFEAIDPGVAGAIARGGPLGDPPGRSVTSFKLGFGPQVRLSPGSYEYVPDRLLRWGYTSLFPRAAGGPLLARVEAAVRGRVGGGA